MTKEQTIQMLESIEERCADFPYMTSQDWVTIAAAKRHLNECIYKEMMEEEKREELKNKDLEEEINKFVDIPENQGNPDLKEELSKCAHHFAQWQKQQMMKEVYTGTYDCDDDTSWIGFKGWLLSTSKVGNKVKLIIIKEE